MKLKDIEPFVRQAIVASLSSSTKADVYNELQAPDCRLFYITEGCGSISIGGEVHKLMPGCVILFQSGTKYIWQIADETGIKYIAINFDYTQNNCAVTRKFHPIHSNVFSQNDILEAVTFTDAEMLNCPIAIYNAGYLENRIKLLTTEYYFGDDYCNELLSATLKSVIISIVRDSNRKAEVSGNKELIITRKAVQYIQNNYSSDITNEQIADAIHFNPIYLNRIFKKHTGTSIHTFLINYRMNMAMELLRSSNMAINEIVRLIGCVDLPHFTKTFKKTAGITPTEYRNSNR